MDPEELKLKFNEAAAVLNTDLHVDQFEIQEGAAQNSFKAMLTPNLALIGTINKKDGSVRDALIMGQGNGTFKSGADIFVAMAELITATNPNISSEDRGGILKELGLLNKNNDINNMDASTTKNGVKYRIQSTPDIGIMFSASDPNDGK